jgi:hypothetical protein
LCSSTPLAFSCRIGVHHGARDVPFRARMRQIERTPGHALPRLGPTMSSGCCSAPLQRRRDDAEAAEKRRRWRRAAGDVEGEERAKREKTKEDWPPLLFTRAWPSPDPAGVRAPDHRGCLLDSMEEGESAEPPHHQKVVEHHLAAVLRPCLLSPSSGFSDDARAEICSAASSSLGSASLHAPPASPAATPAPAGSSPSSLSSVRRRCRRAELEAKASRREGEAHGRAAAATDLAPPRFSMTEQPSIRGSRGPWMPRRTPLPLDPRMRWEGGDAGPVGSGRRSSAGWRRWRARHAVVEGWGGRRLRGGAVGGKGELGGEEERRKGVGPREATGGC